MIFGALNPSFKKQKQDDKIHVIAYIELEHNDLWAFCLQDKQDDNKLIMATGYDSEKNAIANAENMACFLGYKIVELRNVEHNKHKHRSA